MIIICNKPKDEEHEKNFQLKIIEEIDPKRQSMPDTTILVILYRFAKPRSLTTISAKPLRA